MKLTDNSVVELISENSRVIRGRVTEGGASRSLAWEKYIRDRGGKVYGLSNNRFVSFLQVIKKLMCSRKKKLFFLYPTVGVPLNSEKRIGHALAFIFIFFAKRAAIKNELIFDICDLRSEQIVDLDIPFKSIDYIHKIERSLFKINAKYVFASHEMMKYAAKKYHLSVNRIDCCINGANIPNSTSAFRIPFDTKKTNFVYAGTLNRGRGIEKMIDAFPDDKDKQLILMGTDGEWINGKQKYNVKYIGSFEESECHSIVSSCDIGLIPYDSSKLYYNIAYPTKLSFYLTAGIPYLSTPVKEVRRVDPKSEYGYQEVLTDWESLYSKIGKKDTNEIKSRIANIRERFQWEVIFDKCKFL